MTDLDRRAIFSTSVGLADGAAIVAGIAPGYAAAHPQQAQGMIERILAALATKGGQGATLADAVARDFVSMER